MADGNYGGFVENDTLVTHEDQRVGSAQVNGEIAGKKTA
jgi:hypothetical protein